MWHESRGGNGGNLALETRRATANVPRRARRSPDSEVSVRRSPSRPRGQWRFDRGLAPHSGASVPELHRIPGSRTARNMSLGESRCQSLRSRRTRADGMPIDETHRRSPPTIIIEGGAASCQVCGRSEPPDRPVCSRGGDPLERLAGLRRVARTRTRRRAPRRGSVPTNTPDRESEAGSRPLMTLDGYGAYMKPTTGSDFRSAIARNTPPTKPESFAFGLRARTIGVVVWDIDVAGGNHRPDASAQEEPYTGKPVIFRGLGVFTINPRI